MVQITLENWSTWGSKGFSDNMRTLTYFYIFKREHRYVFSRKSPASSELALFQGWNHPEMCFGTFKNYFTINQQYSSEYLSYHNFFEFINNV